MRGSRTASLGVLVGLAASAIMLVVAPMLMPESYSWLAHTTSESAAQSVDGAWLARAGFLVFGFAVLALASCSAGGWGKLATWLHIAFGALMIAAAAFSARSWEPAAAYDVTEDLLHSVAATAMGFAFAFGVAAVAWRRTRSGCPPRVLDVVAIAAAVVLPLAMMAVSGLTGALQRAMFVVAYLWYAVEASSWQAHNTSDLPGSSEVHAATGRHLR